MRNFLLIILSTYFLLLPCLSAANKDSSVTDPDADRNGLKDTSLTYALARLEVPKQLINIGRWGENTFVLLAEKSSQKLYLIDSSYNLVKTYQITTGQNNGNKSHIGDKKTPEGVYFFTHVKEDKELLPQYGLMAIPINYPNFFDRQHGKTGNGIWLHATDQPTRPIKPFDTKGCLVAVNEDVLDIARYIKLQTTPVIIVDKVEFVPLEFVKKEDQRIREFLNKWRESWENKNLGEYIESYSKAFKSRGMDWDAWKRYKASLNKIGLPRKVSIKEIKILGQSDDGFIVSFIQTYTGEGTNNTGIKRLYLEYTDDGIKVIGEEWTAIPPEDPAGIAEKLSEKLPVRVAVNVNGGQTAEAEAKIQTPEDRVQKKGKGPKQESAETGQELAVSIPEKQKTVGDNSKALNIAIEEFEAYAKKGFKARFRLVNKKGEEHKLQGRLAVIAFDDNKKALASFPAMELSKGVPKDFKKGDWYSIRRFKVVEASFGQNKGFKSIKVIVYSLTGKIIMEKEFSL